MIYLSSLTEGERFENRPITNLSALTFLVKSCQVDEPLFTHFLQLPPRASPSKSVLPFWSLFSISPLLHAPLPLAEVEHSLPPPDSICPLNLHFPPSHLREWICTNNVALPARRFFCRSPPPTAPHGRMLSFLPNLSLPPAPSV